MASNLIGFCPNDAIKCNKSLRLVRQGVYRSMFRRKKHTGVLQGLQNDVLCRAGVDREMHCTIAPIHVQHKDHPCLQMFVLSINDSSISSDPHPKEDH